MTFNTSLALFSVLGLIACSEGATLEAADGTSIFVTPFEDGNTFACAHCHATSEPAQDGFRRPGHSLHDAAYRPSYKNGQLGSLRDAVNTCVTDWMRATPLAENDPRWSALESFLVGLSPEDTEAMALSFDIANPPSDMSGGSANAGQELFNTSCAICHGRDAVGTNQGPPLVGGSELSVEYIGERVRRSGQRTSSIYPNLAGGIMPFWAADRLTDDELRNLAAYVNQRSQEQISDMDAGMPSDASEPIDGAGGSRDCEATHPRVGEARTLTTRSHQVAGTITIIDDCTLEATMFDYDGIGIVVEGYGCPNGDPENCIGGYSMSDNLVRSTAYQDETVRFTLPVDRTLDDLGSFTIWCVAVGVSFGDVIF